jgi:hypothetical protein
MGVGDFNDRGALTGAGDIIALEAPMGRGALMGCGPLTGGPFISASGRTVVVSKKTSKLNNESIAAGGYAHNEI